MKVIRWFLRGELAFCGASLLGTAWRVLENYRGLSFGGFMALFDLVLLVPCALALAGGIALHRRTLKTARPLFSLIASALQVLAPLPWLGLLALFGYEMWTPKPAEYWCEWAMAAGTAAGVAGFALCLVWLGAEAVQRKRSSLL